MKLRVENASFSYGKGEGGEVIRSLSFGVDAGELLYLVGPNAVGKSTLLRCMLGILKWSEGRTLLDGQDVAALKPRDMWSHVGYVPQVHHTTLSLTALETVLLGRSAHIGLFSQPSAEDEQVAMRALGDVGMASAAHRQLQLLSGGQQRLVLIAKALATHPHVLVLDEPESGLDFHNQLVVLDLLSQLAHEQGLAVIMTTHYPEHALRGHGKALLLEGPGKALFGDSLSVITEENMRRAFRADIRIREVGIDGSTYRSIIALGALDGKR